MSIKDYPTEELLAELAARVRTDSPLYDPQELRDMLIKSESECSELRAQVERLRRLAKSINSDCNSLRAEVRELRRHLGKTMSERDGLQSRIDAGVRVYRTSNEEWMERKYAGSGASGLLIDIEYMHPDDDRNGEADRNAYRTTDLDAALTLDIESIERKKRADGSTTPRTGERRKDQAQPITCRYCGLVYERGKEKIHNKDTRDPSGANERRAE